MQPQSAPTGNYDFIINPEKPTKPGGLGAVGKDPFIMKIIVLVGGALVVMAVLALIMNFVFGGKTNVETIVALAQTEQEIIRLSAEETKAVDQGVKNAAVNTGLSVKSHQQKWLAYLSKHSREIKKEEMALKRDAKTDLKLKTALQTSTFDATYTTVMRSQLTSYAATLKSAYEGESSKQQRDILTAQYKDVALLLKQWPE